MVVAGITHNNESRVTERARIEAVHLAIELGNDLNATNVARTESRPRGRIRRSR